MGRRKNSFSKAIKHLKSTSIDEKIEMLNEIPTMNTGAIYSVVPNSTTVGFDVTTSETNPDYSTIDFDIDGEDGRDTSGLFDNSGNSKFVSPPGDNSYILGPMSAMYYGWSFSSPTRIGYIRESDRRMVNLASLSVKLTEWDGDPSKFNSYGQLTLEQALWFKDIGKKDGDSTHYGNYRAFYPGPPSGGSDAFGRYLAIIVGIPVATSTTTTTTPHLKAPIDQQASDNFSAIMEKLKKGEKLSKEDEEFLRSQGLDDFLAGGKTGSPLGELALLGMSLAAAKAMLMTLGAIGPSFAKLMANEWSKRTLSDAAYKTFLQTGKMPPGIQGWRPFKALFTLKMLKTGPTAGARRALEAMFYSIVAKFSSSQRKQYQNEINEYKSKLGITEDPEDVPVATPVSPKGLDSRAVKLGYNDPHYPVNPDGYYNTQVSNAQEILDAEMQAEFYGSAAKGESPNYSNAAIQKAKANLEKSKKESENWNKWKKENNYKWRGPIPKEDKVSTPTPVKDDQGTFDDKGNYIPPGYEDAIKTNEIGKPEIDPFKNEIKPGLGAGGDGQQLAMATYGGKVDPWDKILNDIDKASDKLKNQPKKDYPYYGRPGSGMGDRWKVQKNKSNLMTAGYQRKGRVLSESRKKRILKNLKNPVVIPETKQKSYKVSPGKKSKTNFQGMDKLVGDVKPQKSFKKPQDMWSNGWQGYNYRLSQGKKNIVLEKIGEGKQAWNYMLNHGTTMNAKNLEEFWGKNPDFYSYFFNGKKYRPIRKEQVKGDYIVFLVDEFGTNSSMLQSELNIKLAEEDEKKIIAEYNKLNNIEPISYENDPLFKKVSKRLKKEIDYPDKPAKKGYPNEPPPKLGPDGFHPDFGKRYKYDKLDPISATTMKNAPTGNPEIDANVKKASLKSKVKEKYSDWRNEIGKK